MTKKQSRSVESALISAQEISRSLTSGDRSLDILKKASFVIEDGSFTVIHGPSGSGKTTLLNTLAGLIKPDTGTVDYLDRDIYNLKESELAQFRAHTMGIVHQSNYWVRSLNVLENVALPLYFLGYNKENAEREAMESLRRVGMEEHSKVLPIFLSGGEQQRVSMARALVSNPSYIVADEPTGNLDSKNGDDVIELLNYFHKELKRTVILVTHNDKYLKYGTQVITLQDGEITHTTKSTGKQLSKRAADKASVHAGQKASLVGESNQFKAIRLSVLSRIAISNILAKKLRSFLTTVGIGVGVGSIFLLLSFSMGLRELVQEQIISTDSVRVVDVTTANSEVLKLDGRALERFYSLAHTEKIGSQYTSVGEFEIDHASSDAVVYGVDKAMLDLSNITLVAGKRINPDASHEVMMSQSLLAALGYEKPNDVIGKNIKLTLILDSGKHTTDRPFKVTGVISSEKSNSSLLYIPQFAFERAETVSYNQAKVVVNSKDNIAKVRQQIEGFGFQTMSPLDTVAQVDQFFQFFSIILLGFGSAGMLIAIIGIFNTLTIALLERIKEIGLMFALGARRRDVRRLFITESLYMSLGGAVLGMVFATVAGLIINFWLNQTSAARGVTESFSLFVTPPWMILVTLASAAIIGIAVAYIPARRAEKINPIEALRRE